MFAVMGITGKVGGAVANGLLAAGQRVRGIVRNPAKAQHWQERGVEIYVADYDRDLGEAFEQVEGAFVMVPPNMLPDPGYPDTVARSAAIRASVLRGKPARIVALSSWGAEKESGLGLITPNRILEQALQDVPIPKTILRPAWFIDNLIYSLSAAKSTGNYYSFYQPLERAYDMVAAHDVGEIGARTLMQEWKSNRVIEIAGPALHSSNDIETALTCALGRPVQAVAVPRESWVETLAANGMPAERSGAYIEMVDSLNAGWIRFGAAGAEQVSGNTGLVTAVKNLAAAL